MSASPALERFSRPALLALLVVAWIAVVATGMKVLLDYQVQPGAAANAPATWPAASAIPRTAGTPTLVLMAHPRCPCTRATLGELERLVADTRGALDVYVLFVIPRGFDPRWAHGDLWRRAAAMPGVRLIEDPEGREARRFGAFTSGQALLYDAAGQLAFAGGITPGRGHEGDNAGRDAIVACVQRPARSVAQPLEPKPYETPVYGCALASSTTRSTEGGPRCPK